MISASDSTGAPGGTHNGGRDEAPLVTALVPCFNSEAFIEKTLDSLAAQTWPNLEILIADDASTDNTRQKLEAFAAGRSDTRLVFRDQNLGWLANTNALMQEARGEMMFFAFHDDIVLPTYVEELATALLAHPDAILSFCDVELTEVDGDTPHIVTFKKLEGIESPFRRGLTMAAEPVGWWVPNRGLFRKSVLRDIGGIRRPSASEVRADWVWLLELAILGKFVHVPKALCLKFFKPTSLSKNWSISAERIASTRLAAVSAVLESRLSPPGKAFLAGLILLRLISRYTGRKLLQVIRQVRTPSASR